MALLPTSHRDVFDAIPSVGVAKALEIWKDSRRRRHHVALFVTLCATSLLLMILSMIVSYSQRLGFAAGLLGVVIGLQWYGFFILSFRFSIYESWSRQSPS
jgi:phosphoglycerol transferase MdoB-like AlkP superfamily enzyme